MSLNSDLNIALLQAVTVLLCATGAAIIVYGFNKYKQGK